MVVYQDITRDSPRPSEQTPRRTADRPNQGKFFFCTPPCFFLVASPQCGAARGRRGVCPATGNEQSRVWHLNDSNSVACTRRGGNWVWLLLELSLPTISAEQPFCWATWWVERMQDHGGGENRPHPPLLCPFHSAISSCSSVENRSSVVGE
jgi:hypothetical protein